MAKRINLETTIFSYLAARSSRDLLQAARQQLTHDWWTSRRAQFELCISETVLEESAAGDELAARRRAEYTSGLPLLDISEAVNKVAKSIMQSGLLPQRAVRDAIHIAIASVHGIDVLLTWNCRHIANAVIMKELAAIVGDCGYELPILCTPEELMGD